MFAVTVLSMRLGNPPPVGSATQVSHGTGWSRTSY